MGFKDDKKQSIDGIEYKGIQEAVGPLVVIENIHNVGYNELVEIIDSQGNLRLGLTLEVSERAAVVEVFGGTTGLKLSDVRVRFKNKPLLVKVSDQMLGRVFNGLGEPMYGLPEPIA